MSSIDEVLDIDLNDVVSKAIRKQIKQLQKQVADQGKKLYNQSQEIQDLKARAKMTAIADGMIDKLRAKYAAIKDVKDHKGDVQVKESEGKYKFLRELAKMVFGITLEESLVSASSWQSSLVYASRNYKTEVCELLMLLDTSSWARQAIGEIGRFRLPSEYSAEGITTFLRKLHYGYNGNRYGGLYGWVSSGFDKDYAPYEFFMQSPHTVSEYCFGLVLESIKNKKEYSEELFGLPLYNSAVTDAQIKALGSLAADIPIKGNQQSTMHGKFIAKYLHQFEKADIDKLFAKMDLGTYEWSALNWGIFPVSYQMKAFRNMPFKALKDLVQNHNTRFSPEHQESIFADWFHHNPHPHTPKESAV